MTALVNHPIWTALSDFGNPYPPLKYNSGMGVTPEDRDTAEELGLLPGPDSHMAHKAYMRPHDRSLNESLSASPEIHAKLIRDELGESLRGLARWDNDRIVFLDPNGTRRVGGAELAEIWGDVPDECGLQRDAVLKFAADPEYFADRGHTDEWADIIRAYRRIDKSEPMPKGNDPIAVAIRALCDIGQGGRQ
jgi:hypothetical protein